MKRIVINNHTKHNILVEYSDKQYVVNSGCKEIIEVKSENQELRIIKMRYKSSKFCAGRFIWKDLLRNLWIISLILFIQLDAIVHIVPGVKKIDITENHYHYWMYIVFSCFIINGRSADSYQYHREVDKKNSYI